MLFLHTLFRVELGFSGLLSFPAYGFVLRLLSFLFIIRTKQSSTRLRLVL